MPFLTIINAVLVFVSWKVADTYPKYSFGWVFNMFASALNGAIVLYILTK